MEQFLTSGGGEGGGGGGGGRWVKLDYIVQANRLDSTLQSSIHSLLLHNLQILQVSVILDKLCPISSSVASTSSCCLPAVKL